MKGISAIISIVLLLMITVAMAGFFYFWMSGTIKSSQNGTEQQLEQTADKMSSCMQLDSSHGNKIYVRNCGVGQITNDSIRIFIDNAPVSFSMSGNIPESSTGEVTILDNNIQPGTHSLKISGIGMGIDENADLCTINCTVATTTSSTTTTISSTTTTVTTTTTTGTTTTVTTTTINPIGYWQFSEGSGNSAADSSGNGNTEYLRGSALKFDGTGQYVSYGNSSSLVLGKSMTIEFWMKPAKYQTTWARMVGKGRGVNRNYGMFMYTNGSLLWQFYNGSGGVNCWNNLGSSDPLYAPIGAWTHVIGTYDGYNMSVYVNGVLGKTCPTTQYPANDTNDLTMGDMISPSYPYNGTLDEVRIYNRSIAAAEALQHYNGNFSNNAGLVLYIPFSNKSGTVATDYSGKDNHGILYNFTNTSAGAGNSGDSGWTVYGRPFWTNYGKYNNAMSFNGIDDYLVAVSSSSINITGNITVEAWAKLNSYGSTKIMPIVSKSSTGYSTANSYMLFFGWGNDLYFVVGNGSAWNARSVYTAGSGLNTWMHITGTYNGSRLSIYLNGVLANSTNISGDIGTSSSGLYIGRAISSSSEFWNGTIDSVRVYNKTLTVSQIVSDMSS